MKKTLTLLLITLSFSVSNAQDYNFNMIKSDIESKILLNQWDEILLLAPDLLIAEQDKGDGYYYSALAFFKIDQKDKALSYLTKAENKADNVLIAEINKLRDKIKQSSNAKKDIKTAEELENNDNFLEAASYWKSAWLKDKSQLENGLNAANIFIKNQKFSKALEILEDDIFRNESEAILIINQIKKTPEIINKTTYNSSIKLGNLYFENKNYNKAIIEYEKALKSNFSNIKAKEKLKKAKEEQAWQNAVNSNNIVDTESYADNYSSGKYIEQANKIIEESYITISKDAHKNQNEYTLLKFLKKYKLRFPNNPRIEIIDSLVQDYYFSKGNTESKNKDWSSAINSYEEFLKYSNSEKKDRIAKSSIQKAKRRLKRRSFGFIAGTYELDEKFGLTFGKLNHKGLGWYSNLRTNLNLINEANLDFKESETVLIEFPEEFDEALGSISLGTSFPVLYPIWVYVGGGVNYRETYIKNELNDENQFFSIEDENYLRFFPEAGVMIRLGGFTLSGGASYLEEDFIYQASFGFSF